VRAEEKRWDEALELAREARRIIEGLGDRRRLARIHSAYAYLCLEVDPPRLGEAAHHLDEADALLAVGGPSHELAYVYSERGRLELLAGHPDQTLAHSDRALTLGLDDPLQRADCLYLRGRALAELRRSREALEHFQEASAVFEKTGARQRVASCHREIGEIKLLDRDLEAAVEAFRFGLEALEPRRSRA